MNLSLNYKYLSNSEAITWYPALNEGRIGFLNIYLENIGCNIISPMYSVVLIYENEIIYFSDNENYFEDYINTGYLKDGWYPGDKTMGGFPITGDRLNPYVKVDKKGDYLIYIFITDKKTNNIVGIDKTILNI